MGNRQNAGSGPATQWVAGQHRYSFLVALAAGSAALSLLAPDGLGALSAAAAAATILFLLMLVALADWRAAA